MKPLIYQFIHLIGIFGLTAILFSAIAYPEASRKKIHTILGHLFALFALVGGFGLLAVLSFV